MNIETPYDPWAATAPTAGSASPPPGAVANPVEGADSDDRDGRPFHLFGADGFSFADLVDIVNPLQHVPVVAQLYRGVTGDAIDPGSRLLGGTLFFGPLGTIGAGVNVVVEHETGKDVGDLMMAALFEDTPADEAPADDAPTAVAAAEDPISLAAAGTDGRSAAATALASDPVSAWARQEIAWARSQAGAEPAAPAPSASTALDASRLLTAEAATAAPALAPTDAMPTAPAAPASAPSRPGAITSAASPGGWFGDAMLTALQKYEAAQALGPADDGDS